MSRLLERALDLVDQPILVKELRASLRRLRFAALHTAVLATLGLALVVAMVVAAGETDDPSKVGRSSFLVFLGGQALLALVLFPAATCTSIVEERSQASLDLLVTTRLTPEQVIRGKLLAGIVYGLLFVCSTAPLVAVTFLYGGVAPWQIGLGYAAVVGGGVALACYGALVSAVSTSTARAVVRTFLGLPAVAWLVLLPVAWAVRGLVVDPLRDDRRALDAWLALDRTSQALLALAVVGWPVMWTRLFLVLATNRVRPELGDRDGPLRRWLLGSALGGLALYLGWRLRAPAATADDAVVTLQLLGAALLTLVGAAVALVVPDPRVARGEARARPGRLAALLRPGEDGAAACVLLLAVAAAAAVWLPLRSAAAWTGTFEPLPAIAGWGAAWLLAFTLTVVQGQRALARATGRAGRARGVVVGLLALATLLPLPWFTRDDRAPARLHQGQVLSPLVAGWSLAVARGARGGSRQGTLLGASDALVERHHATLARSGEEWPDTPEGRVAGLTWAHEQARARERLDLLLAEGVPVHVASTGLYLVAGLLLTAWCWRRHAAAPRAAREAVPAARPEPVDEPAGAGASALAPVAVAAVESRPADGPP